MAPRRRLRVDAAADPALAQVALEHVLRSGAHDRAQLDRWRRGRRVRREVRGVVPD